MSTSGAAQQVASAMVPGPALPTTTFSAAEPVGHVVDETLDGQPAFGALGQPRKLPAKPLITPADDDDIHIVDLPEDGDGATVDAAGALPATRHDDQEPPAQAQGSSQSMTLGCAGRRPAELGRDRQPRLHVLPFRRAVLRAAARDRRGRHDDPVHRGVPPR